PEKAQLSNAQRWLFDNDYLLWRSLDRIATDMPLRFFARLRLLPGGTPRIEAVMSDFLADHDRVVVADLQRYLRDQGGETPLDLAELWAVPTFARLALLEKLLAAVESEAEVSAAVLSLHEVQRQDWTRFVEEASIVEKRLAMDPAGIYTLMDDGTRDRYRSAVERLAARTGVSESQVCDAALAAAAATARPTPHPPTTRPLADPYGAGPSHIGTYLVGHRLPELERLLGFTPGIGLRLRRAAVRWA